MKKCINTFRDCENISNVLFLFLCQCYIGIITLLPIRILWTILPYVTIFFTPKAPHLAISSKLESKLTFITSKTFFLCSSSRKQSSAYPSPSSPNIFFLNSYNARMP